MNINGESIPTRLSSLMRSVVLCTTGLTSSARADLCRMGLAMGAQVNNELTSDTTHLVCASVKSSKYEAATRYPMSGQIVVVDVTYIRSCYEATARLKEINFRIPPLLGLRVALSGFDRVVREVICTQILKGGAVYMPTLDAEMTDILVAKHGNGAKYDAAVAWKIPCVVKQWLDDSISRGKKLEDAEYLQQGDIQTCDKDTLCVNELGPPGSTSFDNIIAFMRQNELRHKRNVMALLSRGQGTCVPILNTNVSHVCDSTETQKRRLVPQVNGAKIIALNHSSR